MVQVWFKLLSQHTALKPSGSQQVRPPQLSELYIHSFISNKLLQTNLAPSALCGQWRYRAWLCKSRDSRVFRHGHFPPYGCGLCSRLPHQKGMSPCKGRISLALKECPSHLWTLAWQKCTQEKHRHEKPRLALPSFAKEGPQSFWINWKREHAAVCKIAMWWFTSMQDFLPCNRTTHLQSYLAITL